MEARRDRGGRHAGADIVEDGAQRGLPVDDDRVFARRAVAQREEIAALVKPIEKAPVFPFPPYGGRQGWGGALSRRTKGLRLDGVKGPDPPP